MASRIFEAARVTDGTGAVRKGIEIDKSSAIALRKSDRDVVVCGDNLRMNIDMAKGIEAMIGAYDNHVPHRSSGPAALPHFQQRNPPPAGHTFYETPKRKARKSQ